MRNFKYSRDLQTANFKRDYVMVMAVVIFFGIVVGEVALAVSIPVYFVRSDLWAIEIARQSLHRSFDGLRLRSRKLDESGKLKDSLAGGENQLVLWDLNMMAHYLRAHRETMSPEQAAAIIRELNGLARIQARAAQKKPYNRIESLDPRKALDRFAAELERKVKTDEK